MSRILRIRADELMAGDTIVIKEGSIRKFFHVCEVAVQNGKVKYTYNGRGGTFVHEEVAANVALRVRE